MTVVRGSGEGEEGEGWGLARNERGEELVAIEE